MQYDMPLVAVTAAKNSEGNRLLIHQGYMKMLLSNGVMPVLLPLVTDEETIAKIVERFDGFVISGGGDINSEMWGEPLHEAAAGIDEERDLMESVLLRMLHEKSEKPVLGVCRGEQIMNVALGGTLYQDIPTQVEGTVGHRNSEKEFGIAHTVNILPDTLLASIVGEGELGVNTLHHQASCRIAPVLRVNAVAPDGVIEGVESVTHPFFLGVQWHPERLGNGNDGAKSIFEAFCNVCKRNYAR